MPFGQSKIGGKEIQLTPPAKRPFPLIVFVVKRKGFAAFFAGTWNLR
jgi:hypothetical protein